MRLAAALVRPLHYWVGGDEACVGVVIHWEKVGRAEFDVRVCIVGEGGWRDHDAWRSGHTIGIGVVPVRIGQWDASLCLHVCVWFCVDRRGERRVGG